ncbi:hypothetical protein [Leptothoe spongobia]|uniref:Uncharacterized protein n=1 Tax=Leptothoe spongobia TAU-MAC 1115 TaxID=1967444 RepID=A0A947DBQ8_9CYAN|nr:hypothetical protein [Leptothoe spongobia]MBT9314212.1 hypothetical protein [Leptothoe spongobia TAU-MAC 1115]
MSEPDIVGDFSVVRVINSSDVPGVGEVLMGYQAAQIIESVKSDPKQVKRWTSGVPCQALTPGGQWTKGTVKFAMLFTPADQPDDQNAVQ